MTSADRTGPSGERTGAHAAPGQAPGPASERELRLALVCYGGVSLAVHMHGISCEILKLVRASRAYNALPEDERAHARYTPTAGDDRETDTEHVYFDLFRALGERVALRVVVDVIAGASAGGINAVMLARALAFDRSLDRHRALWLDLADVTVLLDPSARAGRWSKFYLRPAFWLARYWRRLALGHALSGREAGELVGKLSLFMRSRWFEPPFSGRTMSAMMLDGLLGMGPDPVAGNSLVPAGLPLEVFVTTTDLRGHRQYIRLHDPRYVQEREHRHTLHFRHVQHTSGLLESELDAGSIPALAFAARATSSFPGAFPPAGLTEIDELLAERDRPWPARARFLDRQFAALRQAGENPETAVFIDGSVLMNKPISLALAAIQRHVAHREVDRRLVYLEPRPDTVAESTATVPGFFPTLWAAISEIPRDQPIRDDLEWIASFNEQVRLRRQVAEAVRPAVLQLISGSFEDGLPLAPDPETLGLWRQRANVRAAADAGYAYEGYARLKVLTLLRDLREPVRYGLADAESTQAAMYLNKWAVQAGIRPLGIAHRDAREGEYMPWVAFLRRFDCRHRQRRVLLLIRRANELYPVPPAGGGGAGRAWLDDLKSVLYLYAERLRGRLEWLAAACPDPPVSAPKVEEVLDRIASHLDLPAGDESLERALCTRLATCPDAGLAREVLITYLGFAYYDVLTYPMAHFRDLDALEEIKVDRIAVDDANTLRAGRARDILKGVGLRNFGAFFSRAFRENDYLWGRLTAAERLVDIVASAVPEVPARQFGLRAFKRRLFLSILEAETPHLGEIADLIGELRDEAERL